MMKICNSMSIIISVSDLTTFTLTIPIITAKVKKDSLTYKLNYKNAVSLISTLTNMQNSTDEEITNTSSADEILKYKNLLDNGIITQDEFEAKKKQLLNL